MQPYLINDKDQASSTVSSEKPVALKRASWVIRVSFLSVAFGIISLFVVDAPPANFPASQIIEIKEGQSINEIASLLKEEHFIQSAVWFRLTARLSGKDRNIVTGVYSFKDPLNTREIIERLESGAHGVLEKKITIPEGLTRAEMSERFSKELPAFNQDDFLSFSKNDEGYLFPDTYFFYENATASIVYMTLRENFDTKTADLRERTKSDPLAFRDIITLASLVEEEAQTTKDRQLVAGIMRKRLEMGMPLQVDATFQYINGKGSLELTTQDLSLESPYNTYRNKGLPPTPISNPGRDAISATIDYTSSPYIFYLSDKEGNIHYAKTFEEHKLNKAKYLR